MKISPDPIGVLRAAFAGVTSYRGRSRVACQCVACRNRTRVLEADESPRKPLGVGVFGVRAPGARSRYRESFVWDDGFRGRAPGGHHAPVMRKMPPPSFVQRARAERLLLELREMASRARVPRSKIGTADQYRSELVAQAAVEFFTDENVARAFWRAEKQLAKLQREVAVDGKLLRGTVILTHASRPVLEEHQEDRKVA